MEYHKPLSPPYTSTDAETNVPLPDAVRPKGIDMYSHLTPKALPDGKEVLTPVRPYSSD